MIHQDQQIILKMTIHI